MDSVVVYVDVLMAQNKAMMECIELVREHCNQRMDADMVEGHYKPNPEMRLLTEIDEILKKVKL